jgi:hypothetical protein
MTAPQMFVPDPAAWQRAGQDADRDHVGGGHGRTEHPGRPHGSPRAFPAAATAHAVRITGTVLISTMPRRLVR